MRKHSYLALLAVLDLIDVILWVRYCNMTKLTVQNNNSNYSFMNTFLYFLYEQRQHSLQTFVYICIVDQANQEGSIWRKLKTQIWQMICFQTAISMKVNWIGWRSSEFEEESVSKMKSIVSQGRNILWVRIKSFHNLHIVCLLECPTTAIALPARNDGWSNLWNQSRHLIKLCKNLARIIRKKKIDKKGRKNIVALTRNTFSAGNDKKMISNGSDIIYVWYVWNCKVAWARIYEPLAPKRAQGDGENMGDKLCGGTSEEQYKRKHAIARHYIVLRPPIN